jgi:hypothetical protein
MDIIPGRIYRHYKGGLYRVVTLATDATNVRNGTTVVIYEPIAGSDTYCRDLQEFISPVHGAHGSQPRFSLEP